MFAQKKEKDLVDLVFSWKLNDVLNNKLYKDQVKDIPRTFSSLDDYTSSFMVPLIEETRAALRSNLELLSQAPVFDVLSADCVNKKLPVESNLTHYKLVVQQVKNGHHHLDPSDACEPKSGDLFALSSVRPKSIGDLMRSSRPYTLAFITKGDEDAEGPYLIEVSTSKPLAITGDMNPKKAPVYAVLLENLTTNNRIWKSLKMGKMQNKSSYGVMKIALYNGTSKSDECDCWSSTSGAVEHNSVDSKLSCFDLNEAQAAAVLSCLSGRKCYHQPTAKLIWGPPGTGKTKTVTVLLWSLLEQRCQTVTCAPTNVAVVQIASRLLQLLVERMPSACNFGDVILFGNEEKMKIKEQGLEKIYLKRRVDQLKHCFAHLTGWNNQLKEMKALFQDCISEYNRYLEDFKKANESKSDGKAEEENCSQSSSDPNQNMGGKGKNEEQRMRIKDEKFRGSKPIKGRMKQKQKQKEKGKWVRKDEKVEVEEEAIKAEKGPPLTFKDYVKKRFVSISESLRQHIEILREHLPSKKLTLFVIMLLNKFHSTMKSLRIWLNSGHNAETDLEKIYTIPVQIEDKASSKNIRFTMDMNDDKIRSSFQLAKKNHLSIQDVCNGWCDMATKRVWKARLELLRLVSSLLKVLKLPVTIDRRAIEEFCLANATLILCTACSSFRLSGVVGLSVELLIVDEAAQLKECESLIPMQLPGLRHAILIGDECQLPAMVVSEVCQRAYFGRSLFERLVSLGHEKHLLNIQYRMHPSISIFPNEKFYDKLIMDGENVKLKSYERHFLNGRMYGPYSFINVLGGIERFDAKHSRKNMAEVEVASMLVEKLFQVVRKLKFRKFRLSIGIISPYTAQVVAIDKKLGNQYEKQNGFSVKVKSVDGFQGGEEDIIIMSTVRSNMGGSVGFLSNLQRTNVALTRAKHCLWILGNGTTLINSGSIWKDVVLDAINRGCFFEAESDNVLVKDVGRNIELDHFSDILSTDSPFFSDAKWKVLFADEFRKSFQNIRGISVRSKIIELVKKLANGFRPKDKRLINVASRNDSFNLLKYCNVQGQGLFWTVEICKDSNDSNYIQVLKFWETLPMKEAPKLMKKLDDMFQKYSKEYISHCRFRCSDGESDVPMCWPIGENVLCPTTAASDLTEENLGSHFASLNLGEISSMS